MTETAPPPKRRSRRRLLDHRRLWLTIPEDLQRDYRRDRQRDAARGFRHRSVLILALYLLISTGIYLQLPDPDRVTWLIWYGWVGVIVGVVALIARNPRWTRWFPWYAGVGSALAMAVSIAVAGIVEHPQTADLTQTAIIYAVVIIYSLVGLSLLNASLAAWSGGLLGWMLCELAGGQLRWEIVTHTYVGMSLLGMAIAYLMEMSYRKMYLQASLLRQAYRDTQQYAEKITNLSKTDALTGLSNRRHLEEFLPRIWQMARREGQPVTALMIDVDHFKSYNDYYGHLQGDRCLRQVAGLIACYAKRAGDIAVRYGGEEFLLVLTGTNQEGAGRLANDLRKEVVNLSIPSHAPGAVVTISIGISVKMPQHGVEPEHLFQHADSALYQAKEQGRNRVVIHTPDDHA